MIIFTKKYHLGLHCRKLTGNVWHTSKPIPQMNICHHLPPGGMTEHVLPPLGSPQMVIPQNRIIDYTMYRLVEKIDAIIIYLTFVLIHK